MILSEVQTLERGLDSHCYLRTQCLPEREAEREDMMLDSRRLVPRKASTPRVERTTIGTESNMLMRWVRND